MITDSNQACITKMSGCGLQEVLNEFPSSNFFKQVDGKNWGLHLLLYNGEMN